MLEPKNLIVHEILKSKTSNNEYDVFIFDNCIACTCPAGGKKQLCKHLISTIHKNLEVINNVNPDFCKQLVNLIELKQNKNIPQNEKLEEYAKFIYSNKDIAAISHKNTIEIKDSDKRELDEIGILLLKDTWLGVNFYDFIHQAQKTHFSIFAALKTESLLILEKAGYIRWQELTEDDKNYLNLNNKYEYCAFSATEKLYTNTRIAGFSRGLKHFSYSQIDGDIGIKFLKENCNIIIT